MSSPNHKINIGVICEEFFRADLCGFGGFGHSTKTLAEHFNNRADSPFNISVLLSTGCSGLSEPCLETIHSAQVLKLPQKVKLLSKNTLKIRSLIKELKISVLLSVDFYPTYPLLTTAGFDIPCVVWIRDPRDEEEWNKLSTVPAELVLRRRHSREELVQLAAEKKQAIHNAIKTRWIFGQPNSIKFASNARFLIPRAERTYGISNIQADFLPNAIPFPKRLGTPVHSKPAILYVGRIEPVKRSWIVFELARRFPNVEFWIAGTVSIPQVMQPIIDRYKDLPNLKFLGLIEGGKKQELYESCWGLINTSIHEGLPVTFLESFYYGKPVISCQNPDGLTEKFGYFTGEFLGEGMEENCLKSFENAIGNFLKDDHGRAMLGQKAKQFVEENYSYSNFENQFMKILTKYKVVRRA